MLPKEDLDDEFLKELEKCKIIVKEPTGRYAGHGGCQREIVEEVTTFDFFRMLRLIISLLRRRGMLWETESTEIF